MVPLSHSTNMDPDDNDAAGTLAFSLYSAPSITSASSVKDNMADATHQPSSDDGNMILSNQFTRVGHNINPSLLEDEEDSDEDKREHEDEGCFPATQLDDHVMAAIRCHEEQEQGAEVTNRLTGREEKSNLEFNQEYQRLSNGHHGREAASSGSGSESRSVSCTTSYMGTFNVEPLVTQDTINTEKSRQLRLRNVHTNIHFSDSVSNSELQSPSRHSSHVDCDTTAATRDEETTVNEQKDTENLVTVHSDDDVQSGQQDEEISDDNPVLKPTTLNDYEVSSQTISKSKASYESAKDDDGVITLPNLGNSQTQPTQSLPQTLSMVSQNEFQNTGVAEIPYPTELIPSKDPISLADARTEDPIRSIISSQTKLDSDEADHLNDVNVEGNELGEECDDSIADAVEMNGLPPLGNSQFKSQNSQVSTTNVVSSTIDDEDINKVEANGEGNSLNSVRNSLQEAPALTPVSTVNMSTSSYVTSLSPPPVDAAAKNVATMDHSSADIPILGESQIISQKYCLPPIGNSQDVSQCIPGEAVASESAISMDIGSSIQSATMTGSKVISLPTKSSSADDASAVLSASSSVESNAMPATKSTDSSITKKKEQTPTVAKDSSLEKNLSFESYHLTPERRRLPIIEQEIGSDHGTYGSIVPPHVDTAENVFEGSFSHEPNEENVDDGSTSKVDNVPAYAVAAMDNDYVRDEEEQGNKNEDRDGDQESWIDGRSRVYSHPSSNNPLPFCEKSSDLSSIFQIKPQASSNPDVSMPSEKALSKDGNIQKKWETIQGVRQSSGEENSTKQAFETPRGIESENADISDQDDDDVPMIQVASQKKKELKKTTTEIKLQKTLSASSNSKKRKISPSSSPSRRMSEQLSQNSSMAVSNLIAMSRSIVQDKTHDMSPPKRSPLLQVVKKGAKKGTTFDKKLSNYDFESSSDEEEELQDFEVHPTPHKKLHSRTTKSSKSPSDLHKNSPSSTRVSSKKKRARFAMLSSVVDDNTAPTNNDEVEWRDEEDEGRINEWETTAAGDVPFSVMNSHLRAPSKFADIWEALKGIGWYYHKNPGHPLVGNYVFVRPNTEDCDLPTRKSHMDSYIIEPPKPIEDPRWFATEEKVLEYVHFCVNKYGKQHHVQSDSGKDDKTANKLAIVSGVTKSSSSPSSSLLASSSALENNYGAECKNCKSVSVAYFQSCIESIRKELEEYLKQNYVSFDVDNMVVDEVERKKTTGMGISKNLTLYADAGSSYFYRLSESIRNGELPLHLSLFLSDLHELVDTEDISQMKEAIISYIEGREFWKRKIEDLMDKSMTWKFLYNKFLVPCGWTDKKGQQLVDWWYISPEGTKYSTPDAVITIMKEKLLSRGMEDVFKVESEQLKDFLDEIFEYVELKVVSAEQRRLEFDIQKSVKNKDDSPSPSSPFRICNWFVRANTKKSVNADYEISWQKTIWPELERSGWKYDETDKNAVCYRTPGNEPIVWDVNAFRSQVGVRRYLQSLCANGHEHSVTSSASRTKKDDSSSHEKKTNSKFNGSMITPLENIVSGKKISREISQATPLKGKEKSTTKFSSSPSSSPSRLGSKRSRSTKKSYGEDFVGESQFDIIDQMDYDIPKQSTDVIQSTSHAVKNAKKKHHDADFDNDGYGVNNGWYNSGNSFEDEATQAISPTTSPANVKSSKDDTNSVPPISIRSKREAFKALPVDATSKFIDDINRFPTWLRNRISVLPSQESKELCLFANLRFHIAGIPQGASKRLTDIILRHGGTLIDSLPWLEGLHADNTFEERASSADSVFSQLHSGRNMDDSEITWKYNNVIVVSHPNHMKAYMLATALRIPVIHPRWISDCIRKCDFLSIAGYQLPTAMSPLRPYMSFIRAFPPQGVFCGLRVLNMCSDILFTDEDLHYLTKYGDMYSDLLQGYTKPNMHGKDSKVTKASFCNHWFTKCLLAAGATLCDPVEEIKKVSCAVHLIHNPNYYTRDILAADPNTYLPPDVIIVDGLVFSNDFISAEKPRHMSNSSYLTLHTVAKFEDLMRWREEDSPNGFDVAPSNEKTPYQRIAGRAHGLITTSDWALYCIGLGTMLFPCNAYSPVDLLAITEVSDDRAHIAQFYPPDVFALPADTEVGPLWWRHEASKIRFSVGDFVCFKHSNSNLRFQAKVVSSGKSVTSSVGRIIEFPRKGVDSSVNVRVNVMSRGITDKMIDRWNQQLSNDNDNSASSSSVLGDAMLLLIKKVAVFSSEAFKALHYCNNNPDQDVFCISEEYEQRDGLVTWGALNKEYNNSDDNDHDLRVDKKQKSDECDKGEDDQNVGDIYQILGFDHRIIEDDTAWGDDVDLYDYGAPDPLNCSQEW